MNKEQPDTEQVTGEARPISRRKLLASIGMAGAAAFMGGVIGNANGTGQPLFQTTVSDSVYGGGGGGNDDNDDLLALDFVVAVTIAELRAMLNPNTDYVYLITDRGHEGHFVYDPSDTSSADNTGTVIVAGSGARYKRLLESPYLNVQWFGAKGDGVTDDMAVIQKAIDTALALGGGTVFFPIGTYIVSPSGSTKINLRNEVNLLGEGFGSVIKVKDNAGDYGMIFGSANTSVPLRNVRISNLRVDQNPEANLTCNIDTSRTDSHYWQFALALYNYENIKIDHVVFDPTCGINTITLNNEQCKYATVSNCRFNFVMAKGDPTYDNSAIYLKGRNHTVMNCLFYAAPGQRARGAIETHGGQSVISSNVCDGYYTGVNAQGSSIAIDNADITIANNTISNANQGIQLWPLRTYPLKNVTISGNTIRLANTVHQRNLTSGIASAGGTSDTGGYENFTITGNTIVFQEEFANRPPLNDAAYGIALIKENDVANIIISDNVIRNAPVSGIRIGSNSKVGSSRNVQITNNVIVNAGHYPASSELYRCAIMLRSTVDGAVISGNLISDTYDNARGLFSIRVNDFDGTFTNVSVMDNRITTKQGGLWLSVSPSVEIDTPVIKTTDTSPPASGTYNQGEVVLYTGLAIKEGQTPAGFKVTATGTAGTLNGVTATGAINTSIITVSNSSQLTPEQWIVIQTGNQRRRIVHIAGSQVRLNANLTADVPFASPVSFAPPAFVPFGIIGKLPGIADTSGSTLAVLEEEVNALKQALRDSGVMA